MGMNSYQMPEVYPPRGEPVVRMRGIRKVFHSAAGESAALKGIDIDVRQGEFVSVIGRSGSGKSTLVNMITGIDRPTEGTVEVGGVELNHKPESSMAVWRGKNLGIVFQFFQLLPMLTLIENVMLPMDFCNIFPPARREERALILLKRVGLEKLAHQLPGAVAGGQQQSAAVARALANDPPILIADEPTGNLDSGTAGQVLDLFAELVAQGKTILMVTHDRALAERTSRQLIISDGELVDEALAAALPGEPHAALLRWSKRAVRLEVPPGQPLAPGQLPAGHVLLVVGGELSPASGTASRAGAGEWLDLYLAPRSEWRAGEGGARLLALPRDEAVLNLARGGVQPSDSAKSPLKRASRVWQRQPWRKI